MYRDPPHYLSRLKTTRVPGRLAFMDIQTNVHKRGKNSEYGWQCGALGHTHWTDKKKVRKDFLKVFEGPRMMWTELDAFCTPGKRVVCWTFDLPVQLRTSQALIHLPKFGWHLETIVLEPGAAWALLKDDKRSLMFCDLKAWTPYEWERVKNAVMGRNHDIAPGVLGGIQVRNLAYNRAQIIREAVIQIIEWIERDGLGVFRPTGSGQSYSAFRRRYLTDRILVHDDQDRLRAERISMWAGRTEAWQHGDIQGGPFIELDMRAAYTRIASQCSLPTIAVGGLHKPTVQTVLKARGKYEYLCHVQVETETPVVPASGGTHTFWPVGRFDTWVWTPELVLLDTYATRVRITGAYKYRVGFALRDFSSYILSTLDAPPEETLGLPALVMKHWSRTLVGRLGLRYRAWIPFSSDNDPDLSMCTFIDYDENSMTDMLCVGRDMLLLGSLEESVESVPQIPAWVMSECRRRLWETMVDIGLERIVYVDTDSIIIATSGNRAYERNVLNRYSGMWAPKAKHIRMHIRGPRNLTADTDRRMSGLPANAIQAGPMEYRGEVLRSIKESMRHGQLGTVQTVPRKFMFTAPDIRRKHLPNGKTEAFRIEPKTTTEDSL